MLSGPRPVWSASQFRAGDRASSKKLLKRLFGAEWSGSVRAACTSSIRASGFSARQSSLRARSTSALTVSSLGVVSRPGAPPVPGGMTNSGPLAASTINVRGAIRLATSASPNCSSRPKTLRSTGCRQTSLRSSK